MFMTHIISSKPESRKYIHIFHKWDLYNEGKLSLVPFLIPFLLLIFIFLASHFIQKSEFLNLFSKHMWGCYSGRVAQISPPF